MKISNKKIIVILCLGLIFIILSTINYAYRIPELDKQISDKKSEHDFSLEKFYDAQLGYTTLEIDLSTISMLSALMNISDIKLNDREPEFIEYRKNGVSEKHTTNETEAQILMLFILNSRASQRQILMNFCFGLINCSDEQIDKISRVKFDEMEISLLKSFEEHLKRTKIEITDLEKEKQNILFWSLIFQISGISLSQLAIIMQIIKEQQLKSIKK